MNIKTTVYCPECHKTVKFIMQREERYAPIKGVKYPYLAKVARCVHCNEKLDVYHDENLKLGYDAYREAHNLISLEQIREIPEMYNIGKRVLSSLLGWGEHTFTRFYDGYLPTKEYSDTLKKLYNSPAEYRNILEDGRNVLTQVAYNKSKLAVQKLLSVNPTSIMITAGYLKQKKEDLSSYRLQKLLYYTQAVSLVFKPKPIFSDLPEAWVSGPVYPEVFHKNKGRLIDNDLGNLLTNDEQEVVNCVLECFGRYDGDTLVEFTHREDPWIKARGELPPEAPSNEVISIESIIEYFSKIKDANKMKSMMDIKKYAQDMIALVSTEC